MIQIHTHLQTVWVQQVNMLNILKAYSEPHRHFHTFGHVSRMLINAEHYKGVLSESDYQTLILAILYHDYVYVPSSKTNEQDSVDEFMDQLLNHKIDYDTSLIKQNELAGRVLVMILDTVKHEPTFELSKYLIDLDLWGLAFTDEYEINSKLIEREYIDYSRDIYVKGRINWINEMLDKDQIYYTSVTKNLEFEEQARTNLKNELHQLITWG